MALNLTNDVEVQAVSENIFLNLFGLEEVLVGVVEEE